MTAGATLVVAGCGSDKPGTVAKDGSVTVKHVFGETKIPAPPTRVVSAGLTEQDDLLALGVVPIAVTDWFGGEPFGVWPWAQPKLGGAQPDGAQPRRRHPGGPDRGAEARSDRRHQRRAGPGHLLELSEIAPTVAQSGQDAFFEPWKDQATTIGQAVFQARRDAGLDRRRRREVHRGRHEQPRSSPASRLRCWQGRLNHGRARGPHPRLAHRVPHLHGPERLPTASTADVLIWTTESDEEQAALLADPAVARRGKANMLHRQGTRRGDRVRLAALLSGGGRPTAAAHRPALA